MKIKNVICALSVLCLGTTTLLSQEHTTKYGVNYYPHSSYVRNNMHYSFKSDSEPITFIFDGNRPNIHRNDSLFREIYHKMNKVEDNKDNVFLFECELYTDNLVTDEEIVTKGFLDKEVLALMYRLKVVGVRYTRMKFTATRFPVKKNKVEYRGKITVTRLRAYYDNFNDLYPQIVTDPKESWKLYSVDHNGKVVTEKGNVLIIERGTKKKEETEDCCNV